MAAPTHACLNVKTFEETAVAHELATSLRLAWGQFMPLGTHNEEFPTDLAVLRE